MSDKMKSTAFDRLFSRAMIVESGCWEFAGCRNADGYGRISVAGRKVNAHCLAYDLVVGDIPDGYFVLHSCDNPCCVNPEHLFLGTQQDNVDDMISKGRQTYLHTKGELNGRAKLSTADIVGIKQLLNAQISQREIGSRFDVSQSTISKIACGQAWVNGV